MKKHPNQHKLLEFLRDKLDEEENIDIAEHLAICEYCIDRVHSLNELTENFDEIWDGMTKELCISKLPANEKYKKQKGLWFKIYLSIKREIKPTMKDLADSTYLGANVSFMKAPPEWAVAGESETDHLFSGDLELAGKKIGRVALDKKKKTFTFLMFDDIDNPLQEEVVIRNTETGKEISRQARKIEAANYKLAEFEDIEPGIYEFYVPFKE